MATFAMLVTMYMGSLAIRIGPGAPGNHVAIRHAEDYGVSAPQYVFLL